MDRYVNVRCDEERDVIVKLAGQSEVLPPPMVMKADRGGWK